MCFSILFVCLLEGNGNPGVVAASAVWLAQPRSELIQCRTNEHWPTKPHLSDWFLEKVLGIIERINTVSYAPCMEYLPTFPLKITQM